MIAFFMGLIVGVVLAVVAAGLIAALQPPEPQETVEEWLTERETSPTNYMNRWWWGRRGSGSMIATEDLPSEVFRQLSNFDRDDLDTVYATRDEAVLDLEQALKKTGHL